MTTSELDIHLNFNFNRTYLPLFQVWDSRTKIHQFLYFLPRYKFVYCVKNLPLTSHDPRSNLKRPWDPEILEVSSLMIIYLNLVNRRSFLISNHNLLDDDISNNNDRNKQIVRRISDYSIIKNNNKTITTDALTWDLNHIWYIILGRLWSAIFVIGHFGTGHFQRQFMALRAVWIRTSVLWLLTKNSVWGLK